MNSYSRYGYVVGILTLLACIAVGLFFVRGDFSSNDLKTYSNTEHGFGFEYPSSFFVSTPLPEASGDTSLSDEQREELFQEDLMVWQEESKKINKGVVEKMGDDHRTIYIEVMDPVDFPTRSEGAVLCEESQRLNPGLGVEACFPNGITREDLEEEMSSIMTGVLGAETPVVHKVMPGGVVVEMNDIRGIRSLALSSDTGEYTAAFTTYNDRGERITLSLALVYDEHPPIISPLDEVWLQKAENDPRTKEFDDIISSFTLL